jgi:hypothetical protein
MAHNHLLTYPPRLPVFFNFTLPASRRQLFEKAVKLLVEKPADQFRR